MNRLARELSPYLLQHAHNPVDWFPWGDEAFAKARAESKPIFLSVGYSTCHWCHVMERESFESDEVARVLNEHFVSIKVDREERPDVDRVYMAFVQATTGSGGWPMSVWLTPQLKPFYGGTYFPPSSRWGRPGFIDVLREIARVWQVDRGEIAQSAEALTARLQRRESDAGTPAVPGDAALGSALQQLREAFDARHGGFGDAPKFPRPSELLFLLREHARTGNGEARDMALSTLRAMALGGIRDHVGGGFHRYSVDQAWRIPHFEKMLYDQAQLVLAFLEAAQVSDDSFYAEVAGDTLQYVQREMTDETGGFYSAEDADSVPPEQAGDAGASPGIGPQTSRPGASLHVKTEGAFYLWRADEFDALLGDGAPVARLRFGVEPGGNAPFDPQQEFTGKNLLYVAASIDEIARQTGRGADEIVDVIGEARLRLFEARAGRPRPHLDDKVLTAWNGLMIAAFARGARVLAARGPDQDDAGASYLRTARRAAGFIRDRLWRAGTGTLLRRYRKGDAQIDAYAEDYAFLIFGVLELFQADPDPAWLEWAIVLQRRQDELFWDEEGSGWFSTTGRDASVLLRLKDDYDGAEPSANSVSVMNLIVLSHLVADPGWNERIDRTLRLFGARLEQRGRGVPMMAAALSARTAGLQQIVLVGDHGREALARMIARQYLPFALTLDLDEVRQRELSTRLPFIAGMRPCDGRAAAYVCRDFACRQPVVTTDELQALVSAR